MACSRTRRGQAAGPVLEPSSGGRRACGVQMALQWECRGANMVAGSDFHPYLQLKLRGPPIAVPIASNCLTGGSAPLGGACAHLERSRCLGGAPKASIGHHECHTKVIAVRPATALSSG